MIERNVKKQQELLEQWKKEYHTLVGYQLKYSDNLEKMTAESLVMYQMSFIDRILADFDDVVKEYINMLLKTPPRQNIKLNDLCDQAEDYIKERYPEDGTETSTAENSIS